MRKEDKEETKQLLLVFKQNGKIKNYGCWARYF